MGQRTFKKLIIRTVLLVIFSAILSVDYLFKTNIMQFILDIKVFGFLTIFHVFWVYLMLEMLVVLIPKLNIYSYSGKHLLKHYNPVKSFNVNNLIEYTKKNGIKAARSAIFWIVFNLPFAYIYFNGYVDEIFIYWLFFFYYFFDTFSINVFCIFHLLVTKNKCCNECRIYNWGHFMYCTPLLFIPNFWNYSLVVVSLVILVHWEIAVYRHPERFSSITNKSLQCQHCPYTCRYNPNKKLLIDRMRNASSELVTKFINRDKHKDTN